MASLNTIPTPLVEISSDFISSDSHPLFSMQDALLTYSCSNSGNILPADHGLGTLFFRSGCLVDGILNCTAACQDVNQIFADIHTFQNCMAIVSIQEIINRNISLNIFADKSTASAGYNTAPAEHNTAANEDFMDPDEDNTAPDEDFSLDFSEPSFQDLASGVNQTILRCLYQYWDMYPGNDTVEMCGPQYTGHSQDYKPANFVQFPNVCNNVTSVPLNADVGGIGV